MKTITFTNEERHAIALAAADATVRSAHIPNRTFRSIGKTQAEVDLIALTGEYAVAKAFGLPLSSCGLLLKGRRMDGGHDLTLPDGRTAQIKTIRRTTFSTSPFWFVLETANPREFTASLGILVYLMPDGSCVLAGWIGREDLLRGRPIVHDLGTGKRLGIRSDSMRSTWELVPDPLLAHCLNEAAALRARTP